MPRQSPALALLYSGGAANTNPLLSIGGQASAVALSKYAASQSFTPSSIPGVEITHAARNPVGSGTLQYTVSNNSLTWTSPGAVVSVIVIPPEGGWVAVGQSDSGYLRTFVTPGSLPGSDASQSISIANVQGSVFGAPSEAEMSSGVTEYRALYLHNQAGSDARTVSMLLTQNTPTSDIQIGSTFLSISQYQTLSAEGFTLGLISNLSPRLPGSISASGGIVRERLGSTTLMGHPLFNYFPPDSTQNSDGVVDDVEVLLDNRYDSTNKLADVNWGTALSWAKIPSGRMVSFWLKRTVPASATPNSESLSLDITFDI